MQQFLPVKVYPNKAQKDSQTFTSSSGGSKAYLLLFNQLSFAAKAKQLPFFHDSFCFFDTHWATKRTFTFPQSWHQNILHMKIVTTLPWAITLDINCIFPGETKIEWSLPPTLLQHPELQPSIKLGQFLFVHLREEKMENNKCWEKRREWKNMEKP